jgi:AraC family transcriptional regulator, exoenzyme S synthesis regulatory protein ExsA
MHSIYLDFQFIFFKTTNAPQTNRARAFEHVALFDFGLDYNYFIASSAKEEDLSALVEALKYTIEGHYCFIRIGFEKNPLFFIGVSMDWLGNQAENIDDSKDIAHKVLTHWSKEHSLFTARHLAFYEEYQQVTNRDLLTKSYFLQFLYFFVKDIQAENASRNAGSFKEIDFHNIREITKKITHDIHKSPPSVNEMAKLVGMSVSKFKNLFHELFGISPHQYILDKKMVYAKTLLQTGQYSIRQVAYKVGYHHPSGFTRVYKKKFNHPPNTTYFENHDNEKLFSDR